MNTAYTIVGHTEYNSSCLKFLWFEQVQKHECILIFILLYKNHTKINKHIHKSLNIYMYVY